MPLCFDCRLLLTRDYLLSSMGVIAIFQRLGVVGGVVNCFSICLRT